MEITLDGWSRRMVTLSLPAAPRPFRRPQRPRPARPAGRRGRRPLLRALLITIGLVLGAACVPVAEAHDARRTAAAQAPRHTDRAGDGLTRAERLASADAHRSGRRVEVGAGRTATQSEYADPDGTFTRLTAQRPVRVRQGSGWVPVDPSLARDGHVLRTKATTDALAVSGGGSGPLAALSGEGWRLSLSWPYPLPAPAVEGATATYHGVLPGVDLRVTAADEGFGEQVVITSRRAARDPALRHITFGLHVSGVDLRQDAHGGLIGTDRSGQQVFASPAPMMWDAAGGPGGTAHQARVDAALAGTVLTLRPDPAFLSAPTTRYPVAVDPSFTGSRLAWTTVDAAYPTVPYYNGANMPANPNGQAMVGYSAEGGDLGRSFFRMNTSTVAGKHILSATFQILEKWSWSCTPEPVQLWLTGAIGSGTDWNNQPAWSTKVAEVSTAHGNEGVGCSDGSVEFNVTSMVAQAAASKWSNTTVGLRAANESDTYGWKRFDTNPTLAVTYNSVPDAPASLTIDGHACSSTTFVGSTTPTMRAFVSDPDAGTLLNVSLYWAATGSAISETNKVTQNSVATGSAAVKTIPAGKLADGGTYYFQVRTTDGTDTSPLSAQCAFRVDTSRPDKAATVTSSDYPEYGAPGDDGNTHGGVGQTGSFTFGANSVTDVVSYLYGWQDPPTTKVSAPTPGASVTLGLTPPPPGLLTDLYVRSVDQAGNMSNVTDYQFLAGGPADPAGAWDADEGSGTTLADATAGGHTLTAAGAATWTAARTGAPTDHALHLDGSTGYAQSDAPVVDTGKSFSVAAWVRLSRTDTGGKWVTAVSQNGSSFSSFVLSYNGTGWAFAVHSADTDNPVHYRLVAPGAVTAGVWTHLVGVYDAGAGQMWLYVNGYQAATATGVSTFASTGGLDIGRARTSSSWTDWWPGDVDAVRVWNRAVYPKEIESAANATTLAGAWDLDADGTDASGHGHPVAPAGTAAFGLDDRDGSNDISLDGTGTGWAETTAPVVHTDQSFSVAAWVELARTDTGGRFVTAVSQNDTAFSSFVLTYNGGQWAFALHAANQNDPVKYRLAAPGPVTAGVWTHLAGVYDAGLHQMRLYVNGQLAGSLSGVSAFDSTKTLDIGRARAGSAWTDPWPGDIDGVRVYLGTLDDQQIAQLAGQ
ncbi:LamG-like jellyroll fold domain-containing protein [Streptomyces sp. HPF1205]|uniref:LamG-like jellyroll fold domain-containing protein n=1 Tax=Streptomyces sp. HPF1205 TaxID=2873262 RepID=UPI001CEC7660|nr:LamG-like jellyroll fold domain-containing protein [Streptomyces sp. HPF1205]